MDTNERLGLTSASNAEADALCAGRHLAQVGLPEEPRADDYADIGERLHRAYESGPDSPQWLNLSDDEQEIVQRAHNTSRALQTEWLQRIGATEITANAVHSEERLFASDPNTLAPIHSGKPDLLLVVERDALIEDLKSLYGDITESARNLQLRDYAALVWENYKVETVSVWINQPRVSGKPQVVTYNAEALARAHAEMLARVAASNVPGQPRTPSEKACRYCRAKLVCPAATGAITTLAVLSTKGEIELADRLRLLDIAGAAKKVIASLEASTMYLLEKDPASVPGWELAPGNTRRTVVDPQAAFSAVLNTLPEDKRGPFTSAFITECVTVKVSEFEKQARLASGLKGKAASDVFGSAVEPFVDKKQNKPSLSRVTA